MTTGTIETSNAAMEQAVLAEYGGAAERTGVTEDELLAIYEPTRRESMHATLEVEGIQFTSYRMQVGAYEPSDISRGGLELSPSVTQEKVGSKGQTMYNKQLLGETGCVGGKGGIAATAEEIAYLASNPEPRAELFGQYAIAHDLDPRNNVTATDISTFTPDMDAIAAALEPRFGRLAGAAASGASERYGGDPALHMPRTGMGAGIVLDLVLRDQAHTNPRIQEAINGGRPLRLLVQGLGKAGLNFVRYMPSYIELAGAMERNGAILAPRGAVLDREQVLALAQETGLSEAGVKRVNDASWLPPSELRKFWAAGAEILAPAYDRNQITGDDVRVFKTQGGIAINGVANSGLTPEGIEACIEEEVDEVYDGVANSGGTISSHGIWGKIMHPNGWTRENDQAAWEQNMARIANAMIQGRSRERVQRGEFVSLREAATIVAIQRGARRLARRS